MAQQSRNDEPVTLAEALSNTAFRNAILNNVQIMEALTPSVAEKIGVHLLGISMSLCAGAVNAIAFAKFGMYVSHVTGHSSSIGLRKEGNQEGDIASVSEILGFFIVGAFIGGILIPKPTLKMGQARYDVVLCLVAALEFASWWHELRYPQVLAVAMGLQNAMTSFWSGNVLRTTHMTGTATDLGSALGRIIARFFKNGCSCGSYSEQDSDEHVVDRQKFVLLTLLLLAFIGGGLLGSATYNSLELHALLIPACISALLGINHAVYCLAKWEPLQEQKQQEEVFTRQISQAMGNEGPAAGDANTDRMEQFIRQMSGKSATEEAKEGAAGPHKQALLQGA